MGWAAYRLKRFNRESGEHLGDITIIFPKVATPIDMKRGVYTLSQLLSYPDFPIEAHIFTTPTGYVALTQLGFGNVINLADYANEKWVMNNNAYMEINYRLESGNDESGSVHYFRPDGTFITNLLTNWYPSSRAGTFTWPLCLVGENYESAGIVNEGFYKPSGNVVRNISLQRDGVPYSYSSLDTSYLSFFIGSKPIFITKDPYGDGGVSDVGGGTGTFSDEGKNIDIPALPTISATDAGFITLFNPTLAELQNLASYMWSDLFDINGWKKVFADPMNAILGLSIVPVNVPASSSKPVKVGNVSTDVAMTVADSQYVELDCGTLDVKEFWGAYLDYDPYTKAELYLPYIGTHAIAVDDIMGKSVRIVYHIDILSGACCAYIQCDGTVLYSFIGQCTSSIPITGDNWTNVINGALSIASSVGTMVATGGASAPMSIGQIASTAVNTMKPSIEKSGAMGGTGGLMGVQTPYLIITRPRQAVPGDQNQFIGYPSFITKKLSELSGYTEVESIHLENIPATESELVEIENLLNGGVIF